jgi:hypothetical protein
MFTRFPRQDSSDRKEALQLARQSRHIPLATLILGGFVLLNVMSAVASILAVSPVNPIP